MGLLDRFFSKKNSIANPPNKNPSALSTVLEEGNASRTSSTHSNKSDSLNSGDSGNKRKHIHTVSDGAIRGKLNELRTDKQRLIADHNVDLASLKLSKERKKTAKESRKDLKSAYELEKNKLDDIRKRRGLAENLSDRKSRIENLSSGKGKLARTKLFFSRKLSEVDAVIADSLDDINTDVKKAEEDVGIKNGNIIDNEKNININRNEIKNLKKTIKSNAANLYVATLQLEKADKKYSFSADLDTPEKIKNGKYLFIPLLKNGEFRSIWTQFTYQASRLKRKLDESRAPEEDARKTSLTRTNSQEMVNLHDIHDQVSAGSSNQHLAVQEVITSPRTP